MPNFKLERINPGTGARFGEQWQLAWDDNKFTCRDSHGSIVTELGAADVIKDLDLYSLGRRLLILEPSGGAVVAFEMNSDFAAALSDLITVGIKAHPYHLLKRKVFWLCAALAGAALSLAAAGWGIAAVQSAAADHSTTNTGKVPSILGSAIAVGVLAGIGCFLIGMLQLHRVRKVERGLYR